MRSATKSQGLATQLSIEEFVAVNKADDFFFVCLFVFFCRISHLFQLLQQSLFVPSGNLSAPALMYHFTLTKLVLTISTGSPTALLRVHLSQCKLTSNFPLQHKFTSNKRTQTRIAEMSQTGNAADYYLIEFTIELCVFDFIIL